MQDNYIQDLQNNIINSLLKNHDKILKKSIKNSLSILGYFFNSEYEFLDFCKSRLFIERAVDIEYVFLDYIDEFNKGELLTQYSIKIERKEDNGSITITMG